MSHQSPCLQQRELLKKNSPSENCVWYCLHVNNDTHKCTQNWELYLALTIPFKQLAIKKRKVLFHVTMIDTA